MAQWHGGKGSTKRKGANDDNYRNSYDRIFGQRNSSGTKGNSDTERTDGNATQGSSGNNIPKT